ncbi:NYN domain-containing protein [Gemmatimonas aurantiaca]|uniref:NYN domain-containing protein n=1 Tax=Gemmatimonas aurantiaca TaxID=173480 RepID=UPI00301BDD29
MSTRAMLFIDGTWLAVTSNRMADQRGLLGRTGGPLDFGVLPRLCAAQVAAQMEPGTSLDVVRTHYFASIATNFDPIDGDAVQRRSDFFDALRRHHRYEVYRFETDYRGGRVRRGPHVPDSPFEPREKAVDVGMATALLEMAALSAYDIAIVVCGDRDFVPALQAVRRLGKRVAILSAHGSCAREFSDANDTAHVRDFDTLWLDELWPQLVSPSARPALHIVPGAAPPAVRAEQASGAVPLSAPLSAPLPLSETADQDADAAVSGGDVGAAVTGLDIAAEPVPEDAGTLPTGLVIKVHEHGYGFIRGDDGLDYYFRGTDMREPGQFAHLERRGTRVHYTVHTPADRGSAGRAIHVDAISGLSEQPLRTVLSATRTRPSPVIVEQPPSALDLLWDHDPCAPPPSAARTALGTY